MAIEQILRQLTVIVAEPYTEARRRQAAGQKIIGCLLTDVPEELIHAAGAFPVGIMGSNAGVRLADAHLQVWACSLMRTSLDMGLRGELDFLDGIIIPHTCDTTRMMVGIWRHTCKTPYIDNFLLPRQVNRPSARDYLIGELARLRENLAQVTGQEITVEKIQASIRLFNENRRLLRQVMQLHAEHPGLLTTREAYTVIKAAMLIDKAEHNRLLQELIPQLEQKASSSAGATVVKTRLVISGAVWEPPEILDLIEEAGGVLVGDDFLTGARYLGPDAAEEDDPLAALADRQLQKIPFGGYDNPDAPRANFLVDLVRKAKADGLIFLHLKFCEPENYDYNDMHEALNGAGIPNMRLETEYINPTLGQIRTRMEAFIEIIGGGSI